MRIIVYGAGAVGGIIAGRLFEHRESHGHEVLAIARGQHLEAIRRRGLTVIDAEREVTHGANPTKRTPSNAAGSAWRRYRAKTREVVRRRRAS